MTITELRNWARDLASSADPDELADARKLMWAADEIERLRILEPIAVAALAYHDRIDPGDAEAWRAVEAAVRGYRETMK